VKRQPSDELLNQQAVALHAALRRVMRGLSTLNPEDLSGRLTVPQLRLCNLLSEGPLAMSAIGRELGITLSAVTQIADRLERSQLVQRLAGEDDRRVRLLQLTTLGEEMVRQRDERRQQRACAVLMSLQPAEREAILAAVLQLAEASRRGDDETLDDPSLAQQAAQTTGL
jgi:DNA-binding MarR family transcriptional regulator